MAKKSKSSFAQDFAELEALARKFESGAFDVEQGLEDFERGMALAKQLKDRLKTVEQKVETIKARYKQTEETSA